METNLLNSDEVLIYLLQDLIMSSICNVDSKLRRLLFFRPNQYFMQMTDPASDRFEHNAVFWGTWGGRIVRAIVILDAYSKDAILKATSL